MTNVGIGIDQKGKCILRIDDPYHFKGSPQTQLHVVHEPDGDVAKGLMFIQRHTKQLHLTIFGIELIIFIRKF
jgi:hypothetical protein